jgi:hypothetical protein
MCTTNGQGQMDSSNNKNDDVKLMIVETGIVHRVVCHYYQHQ